MCDKYYEPGEREASGIFPENSAMIWRTRNGTWIPIEKMETSHLQNCVPFLQRRIDHILYSLASMYGYHAGAPDGAQMAVEGEMRDAEEEQDRCIRAQHLIEKELQGRYGTTNTSKRTW